MSQSQAILVLGPHRSGTSALTRVLNLLGVELGGEMMRPKPDNPQGFWEHRAIFEIHERLLSRLGFAWHEYLPLPPAWHACEDAELARLREELLSILRREFGDKPLWGVKDPRLGRLLPLWLGALKELQVEAGFVIVVRNPLEVVRSLERRDRFRHSKCILLYLVELLGALHHTEGRRRVFVSYERLLADWRRVVDQVGSGLRVEWPHEPSDREEEIETFLTPSARHHRHNLADLHTDAMFPEWSVELFQAVERASGGREHELDPAVHRAYDCLMSVSALFAPELDDLENEIRDRDERARRAESELARTESRLEAILSSRLYRYTRALRRIWYRLRYDYHLLDE